MVGRSQNGQVCLKKESEDNKVKIYLPGDIRSRGVYIWLSKRIKLLAGVFSTSNRNKCEKLLLINNRKQFYSTYIGYQLVFPLIVTKFKPFKRFVKDWNIIGYTKQYMKQGNSNKSYKSSENFTGSSPAFIWENRICAIIFPLDFIRKMGK